MNIVAAYPSINIRKASETAEKWKLKGYHVAVLVETDDESIPNVDLVVHNKEWQGFPKAANKLCQTLADLYDIIVLIGDDVYPDENMSHVIGDQFVRHFGGTFGVMQPTGDRYGCIDQAAVCPWIGAEYIKAAYKGNGPYWEGYYHYYCDAELQEAAKMLGVFQQRRDLCQYHDHWGRKNEGRPKHLIQALHSHPHDQELFTKRLRKGFPGHAV